MKHSFALLALFLVACTDQTVERPSRAADEPAEEPASEDAAPQDAGASPDAGRADDASVDAPAEGPPCASQLGSGITEGFGRFDGTVRAVIVPGDFSCKGDNDHVIVQVDAGGSTYAMWINVESSLASDPNVRYLEKAIGALPGPSWSPGWHPSPARVDYALDLGVHAAAFAPKTNAQLSSAIAARVKPGARVSVYADGFATNDGAHKVHRNAAGRDGAIVVDPTGARTYLLFAFADQVF